MVDYINYPKVYKHKELNLGGIITSASPVASAGAHLHAIKFTDVNKADFLN